jgi:hypothetical protein
MRFIRRAVIGCAVLALSACASAPIQKTGEVPRGSEIGVIAFRDCLISGQEEDCNGSGKIAAEAFVEAFSEGGKFTSRLLDRPVGAKDSLSDQAAAEVGRKAGVPYVISGEVDDFYSVAAMTFRSDRAATTMRVIRTSDGEVMARDTRQGTAGSNFATPRGMIKDLAVYVRNSL